MFQRPCAGSASISDAGVSLTAADSQQRSTGGFWSTVPLENVSDWEVKLSFHAANANTPNAPAGEGFVFWFVSEESTPISKDDKDDRHDLFAETDGRGKTMIDGQGLAVIFDSWDDDADQKGPSVSAIFAQPRLESKFQFAYDKHYDGAYSRPAGAVCSMAFRDRALPVNVKLFFLDGTLSVFFDLHSTGVYHPCFTMVDIILPTRAVIGVSAASRSAAPERIVLHELKVFRHDLRAPKLQGPRRVVEACAYAGEPPSGGLF
jgi:hypothetical protein